MFASKIDVFNKRRIKLTVLALSKSNMEGGNDKERLVTEHIKVRKPNEEWRGNEF